jgi:hypothetical protein
MCVSLERRSWRNEGRKFQAEAQPVQRPWGRTSLGDGGAARRPCGWSRGSEGDRGMRRQEGDRQFVQGPVGCREDLGFEPEGGGSHGGLWAGETMFT